MKVLTNFALFISFKMFMCPGGNISIGFTEVTRLTARTKKLINYTGCKTIRKVPYMKYETAIQIS